MQYNNTIIGKILTPINRKKFKYFVDKYKDDFAAKNTLLRTIYSISSRTIKY